MKWENDVIESLFGMAAPEMMTIQINQLQELLPVLDGGLQRQEEG